MDSLNIELSKVKTDTGKITVLLKLCNACDIKENLKYANPIIDLTDKLLQTAKDSIYKEDLLQSRQRAVNTIIYYYITIEGRQSQKITEVYNKHVSICKKYNYTKGIADALFSMADIYNSLGEPIEKLNCLKEGYALMQQMKDKKAEARFIMQLSFFYAQFGDTAQALNYAKKSEELELQIADSSRISRGYVLRGAFYLDIKQYETAIINFKIAEKRYKAVKDTNALGEVYFGIGNVYQEKKDFVNALKYYQLYNDLVEAMHYEGNNKFAGKGGMADVYMIQKKYKEAFILHQEAYEYYKKLNPLLIGHYSRLLANDYYLSHDLKKAMMFANEALELAYKLNIAEHIYRSEKLVYQIDSASGNYKDALIHYQKYLTFKNKLNAEEVHKATVQEKFQNELTEQKSSQDKKDAINAEENKKQAIVRNSFIVGFILLLLFALFIFRAYKNKQKANLIITQQKAEVEKSKHIIEEQKKEVDERQKEIIESITYAKRLQEAILPPQAFIDKHIPDNFILYKPKDLVAGDFYWAESINDLFFIAAADSTGHGVPGAMVSVVCSNALNRSVKEFNLTDTGKILDKTRELVLETFEKSLSEVKDGMDISLLCIDQKNKLVFWSGANNPLWYIQENELKEIKADKQPIGKTEYPKPFTTHSIDYKKDTIFYLFTDGFADQFGGPNGKKFKYKQFSDLLLKHTHLSQEEQSAIISNTFNNWKGSLEQVDDVCIIGVKI
ncbi:MAG: SpoIIE family protein phosphatase [Bacteroidota bacterium]